MARNQLSKDFERYLREVSRVTAKKAAEKITLELKEIGPYWTGQFEESWVVRPGDVNIPATDPPILDKQEKLDGWANGTLPLPKRVTPFTVPEPQTDKAGSRLTIGNTAEYRDISQDLLPGRTPKAGNTAAQDWFLAYVMARLIDVEIQAALREAERELRNFS